MTRGNVYLDHISCRGVQLQRLEYDTSSSGSCNALLLNCLNACNVM